MYNFNVGAFMIVFGIICAVLGWCAIECVLWVFSHISINWK